MTQSEFIARYPEFRTAGDLASVALADAAARVDPTVFGAKTDQAVGLLAAHLLASSPWGSAMRQDDKDDGDTKYMKLFKALRREVVTTTFVI